MDSSGIRQSLADAVGETAATRSVEQQILKGAVKRLSDVNREIEELRRAVLDDRETADRYQHLILERGRLQEVIARSRERL